MSARRLDLLSATADLAEYSGRVCDHQDSRQPTTGDDDCVDPISEKREFLQADIDRFAARLVLAGDDLGVGLVAVDGSS